MKFVQLFSVAILALVVTACGAPQPTSYFQTGLFPQTNGVYNYGGFSQGGEPIYSGSQLIGYRTRTPLVSGSTEVYQQMISQFTTPAVQVNAGEKVIMDLSQSRYEVYRTQCWTIFTVTSNLRQNHPIPGGQLLLNGQPINSGSVVPSAGSLSFKPNLAPLSANCTVLSYGVYLNNAVYKESCVATNGQPMNCP